MKPGACVLTVLLLAAVGGPARADDEACFRAAVEGQKLERAGKLLEARERFVACAQKTCDAATVVTKCAGWLQGVEAALPSLTLAVKDADGRDVLAVGARLDDADASAALGGRSIPVDPGLHRLAVDVGGVTLTETVVMRQGEKDRQVVFHTGARPGAPDTEPTPGRGLLIGGIAAGGVALVSGALFAYFGAHGLSDRAAFGCATGCSADHYQTVHQELVAADVSLGVALGSAVVATVLFAVRPTVAKRGGALAPGRVPALGFAF
jgi:hypothetical protein